MVVGVAHLLLVLDVDDAMTSARFIVGDSLTVLRSMPAESVDLVLTSPPFLALRSYLPADHPDKASEIGQEGGPGPYIDALLDIIEECRRVLVPTGSLVFELGDTYSGSGGAGGDYNEGGLRDGQNAFEGSAKTRRKANGYPDRDEVPRPSRNGRRVRALDEQAGILTPRVRPGPEGRDNVDGWPMDKSLCLVPELLRIALAYGVNPLTGRSTPRWRVRNVVRWCRPNPPVGALADKFRPATSDMVIACMDRARYFDLDAVRGDYNERKVVLGKVDTRDAARSDVGLSAAKGNRGNNPNGAPPLDWWDVPSQPYAGSHYAVWPPRLLVRPILAMCPAGGTVLDPFAGSGTTLAVATGHGRQAIGIDLDERNADLARERVGMWLEVERHNAASEVVA